MSTTTASNPSAAPVNTVPTPTAPIITRNNVPLTLVIDQFGKNSKKPGYKFWTPKLSVSDFVNGTNWVGQLFIINTLNRVIRKTFAEIALDNIDEKTGQLNYDAWLSEATAFDEAGATLSDLEEEIDTITGQMQQIVTDDPQFGETDDKGVATEAASLLSKQVETYASQLKALRAQRTKIRETYQARIAKKEATQKENAAKAALAAQNPQGGAKVVAGQ